MSDVNEVNAETGEVSLRPYTEEELAQIAEFNATPRSIQSEPRSEEYTSAMNKLKALGLTEKEAEAIIGL